MTLWLAASAASAQGDAAKAQAIARYQTGVALHEKGRDEEAYLQFTQAYAVVQTPPILFNLARTEQLTGRLVDAIGHFRAYVAWPEHPRITRELRTTAQGYLATLNAQLGHIVLEAPAGAAVSLDGKDLAGATTIDVTAGAHVLVAKLGDRQTSLNVTASAGAQTPARLVFETVPVVVPVPPIVTPPTVPAPQVTPEQPAAAPNHTARDALRWGTAGLAVVGIGVGVGFFVDAKSQANDFNSYVSSHPSGCAVPTSAICNQAHTLSSNSSQSTTIEAVGFIVGGAAAVTSAALWLFWPRDPGKSTAGLWFVPQVGNGSYSANLGGRF